MSSDEIIKSQQTSYYTITKYGLSPDEQKIILLVLSYIKSFDSKTVEIPLDDYNDIIGLKSLDSEHFNKILKPLKEKTIVVASVDNETGEVKKALVTGWIDKISLKNSTIAFTFNDYIWQYITNQGSEYSQNELKKILGVTAENFKIENKKHL